MSDVIAEQYGATTARLDARLALHARYSVAPVPWQRWVFDQLELAVGERVVEVGAGTGALWEANADRMPPGVRLLLSDSSAAMCRQLASLGLAAVVRADAEALPLRDALADVVIAAHMLYHVPDPDTALGEIGRLLCPAGRVYLATNGHEHLRELEELAAAAGVDYANMRLHLPFTLEDAPRRMQARFSDVRLVTFDDRIEVDSAEPLVRYLESVIPLSASQRAAVREQVDRVLQTDSTFRIQKASGLVVGRAR